MQLCCGRFTPAIQLKKLPCSTTNRKKLPIRATFLVNYWGARIRTSEWLDQNQLPYRLATPQFLKDFLKSP